MQQNSWSFQGLFFRWLKMHTDYPIPMFGATIVFIGLLFISGVLAIVPYALAIILALLVDRMDEYLTLSIQAESPEEREKYDRLWNHHINFAMASVGVALMQTIVLLLLAAPEHADSSFPVIPFFAPMAGLWLYYMIFMRFGNLGGSAYSSFKDWVERKDAETNGKDAD